MIAQLIKYADTIGIIGVVLVLVAYCLLNTNKLSSHDIRYPILNLVGSCLILFSLLFNWNLASVVIEAAWIVISLVGLYKVIQTKRAKEDLRSNLRVLSK